MIVGDKSGAFLPSAILGNQSNTETYTVSLTTDSGAGKYKRFISNSWSGTSEQIAFDFTNNIFKIEEMRLGIDPNTSIGYLDLALYFNGVKSRQCRMGISSATYNAYFDFVDLMPIGVDIGNFTITAKASAASTGVIHLDMLGVQYK